MACILFLARRDFRGPVFVCVDPQKQKVSPPFGRDLQLEETSLPHEVVYMTQLSPATALRDGLRLLRVLGPLSLILTIYLYLFPLFQQCAFPLPLSNGDVDTGSVAFRETAQLHISTKGESPHDLEIGRAHV